MVNEISEKTPNLCHLAPAGDTFMEDLEQAGGVWAVIKELTRANLLDTSLMTVTGKTVGENLADVENRNEEIIRPLDRPYSRTGGIAVLYGNLAPDGCVVKQSAVAPEMMRHKGPARVFNSEDEAIAVIYAGGIRPGDVVVIRYEGPKGGPGMREMLNPTSAIAGMGLDKDVALHHRWALLRRDARRVHRPRQPRGGLRRPHRPCAGGRHDRNRHPRPLHSALRE